MSWREILGVSNATANPAIDVSPASATSTEQADPSVARESAPVGWRAAVSKKKCRSAHKAKTQNTHNTQKSPKPTHCANTADSAHGEPIKTEHHFKEALSDACLGLDISPETVHKALGDDGVDDWVAGDMNDEALRTFAESLIQIHQIDRGERPANYKHKANCKHCGEVWLWFEGSVLGCPWCWNRMALKPIPRPGLVQCGDCIHFKRKERHPNVGHCMQGEPEAIAGLWDTDTRMCDRFLPLDTKA